VSDVRPLRDADVPAAVAVQVASFGALDAAEGRPSTPPDERLRELSARRVRHLLATDPDGCWVAETGGRVAGVALALRRGPLWFLSLLVVDPAAQGTGLGRQLLDAALLTAGDASPAYLCSSNDARALRRYGQAGFALHPAWDADGPLHRALLPAVDGVRTGDWARDGDLVDDLVGQLRGAGYGPDLARWAEDGMGLLVDAAGAGYAVLGPGRVRAVGARDEATATRLLWAALAESAGPDGQTSVESLTGEQQWAVAVAHAARLTLRPGTGIGVRDGRRPPAPYVPSGAYG
jgi:GNAT superfamily N-acetyltransferase